MKESDDEIRIQIDALIRDEIQDNINQSVDSQKDSKEGGLGFVGKEVKNNYKLTSHSQK